MTFCQRLSKIFGGRNVLHWPWPVYTLDEKDTWIENELQQIYIA